MNKSFSCHSYIVADVAPGKWDFRDIKPNELIVHCDGVVSGEIEYVWGVISGAKDKTFLRVSFPYYTGSARPRVLVRIKRDDSISFKCGQRIGCVIGTDSGGTFVSEVRV